MATQKYEKNQIGFSWLDCVYDLSSFWKTATLGWGVGGGEGGFWEFSLV